MDIQNIIKKTAKEKFNIDKLRPMQIKVITNIIENYEEKEANRLLVLLQTGGGKSLCFLLPSVIVEGLTVIVYPLLALMNDQKRRLDELNISSAIIEGGQTREERTLIFSSIRNKKIKTLIINPEALLNESVMNNLREFEITLLVIDEAHTICEWGLTFRPAYKELGERINSLHIQQVLAFTATADQKTLKVLEEYLFFFGDYTIIRGGVDRENIIYHLRYSFSKDREINQILKDNSMRPAIVFCKSRNDTRISYHHFKSYDNKIDCYYYHAGLSKSEKTRIEEAFFKSDSAVLFSTIAFGLGMDKSNIRCVIHNTIINTNVLSFIQESGRGGRDGSIASSIVLFGAQEIEALYSKKRGFKKKIRRELDVDLLKIYQSGKCIRNELCEYMGESIEHCSGCDVCSSSTIKTFDGLNELIKLIFFHPFLYKEDEIIGTLKGTKEYNIGCASYTLLSQWSYYDIHSLIKSCIKINLLIVKKHKIALNYLVMLKLKKILKQSSQ
jgi:ATP-dependent DNA helicase RecQ